MADQPRIEDLRRRIQKDPASIAFAQLAEELRRSGQLQDAIDVCRTGLARHPGYASARVTLGRALLELGQADDARQELEIVLKTSPENLAAIRGLAEIHHTGGNHVEALAYYKAALALARNDPDLDQMVATLRQIVPETSAQPPKPAKPAAHPPESARAEPARVEPPRAEPRQEPNDYIVRTIAVLEDWLTIITAHNAARTQSRS